MNLLLTLLGLFNNSAHAINSINVQTYNPSTSDHFMILEDGFRSEWPKKAKYFFGATYNYVSDPLVVLNSTQTAKAYNVINSISTVDLHLGLKLANNFGLFIGAPIHFVTFPSSYPTNTLIAFPNGTYTAFGDVKLLGKVRLTDDDSLTNISFLPEIHLPTGGTAYFVSDASTYVAARFALEREFKAWTMIVNAGYAAASNSFYQDAVFSTPIDYRKRLILGIGGMLPLSADWNMNFELSSIHMLPFDKNLNPNDAYLGFRYLAGEGVALSFGGSVGRIGGAQGQEFRMIAGLRYTLFEEQNLAPTPISTGYSLPAPQSTPAAPTQVVPPKKLQGAPLQSMPSAPTEPAIPKAGGSFSVPPLKKKK